MIVSVPSARHIERDPETLETLNVPFGEAEDAKISTGG